MSSIALAFICCSAFGLWYLVELLKPPGRRPLRDGQMPKLPPGPKGLPIFGNLLDMQYRMGVEGLRETAKYGEMTTVHAGQKTWVFLNSTRVVSEIIAKRGSATNGRTEYPVSSGIISRHGRSLILPPSGWTERRKLMHHLLNGSALKRYGKWQELESTQMLAEYYYQPDLWYRHHYRYSNSVMTWIALGQRLKKTGSELAELQDVVTVFTDSIGKSIVDWFPILDKLPRFLQVWRPYWEKIDEWNIGISRKWWNPVVKAVEEGIAPPSFARDVLLSPDSTFEGTDQDRMFVAMQLIEAGSDTTREALNIFVMASLKYPHTFVRARKEVESLCDTEADGLRYPVMEDLEKMPYVNAIIKECLRWRPIFSLTPDHASTQEIEFEGYHFPENTGFVINEIAVSEEHEEHDTFKPERYLDGYEFDIGHGVWGFGGGRRICVGYRLAHRGMFLNIARLVLCYDYEAAGELDDKHLNHASTDEPFPIRVKVRSERHKKLIINEATKAGVLEDAKGTN